MGCLYTQIQDLNARVAAEDRLIHNRFLSGPFRPHVSEASGVGSWGNSALLEEDDASDDGSCAPPSCASGAPTESRKTDGSQTHAARSTGSNSSNSSLKTVTTARVANVLNLLLVSCSFLIEGQVGADLQIVKLPLVFHASWPNTGTMCDCPQLPECLDESPEDRRFSCLLKLMETLGVQTAGELHLLVELFYKGAALNRLFAKTQPRKIQPAESPASF